MTVILVLCTFLVFILIDTWLSRHKVLAVAEERAGAPDTPPAGFVDGFQLPENLRYHPGHAWLLRERKNVMRIGIDEFAAALAGRVEKVDLPKPGHWIRQGQRAWSLHRGGEKAEMVSPIEGEVVEINTDVVNDPSLVRKDPYGRGWLFTVFAPDEESTARNLLPAGLVGNWMREAVERLYSRQPELAGAVAADGGRPVEDIAAALGCSWKELTDEFFLTRTA
jgi:glycine cleavage system H lipoate-binding protein